MSVKINKVTTQLAVDKLKDEALVITMEECAELSKECSKQFRQKGIRENIIEEMADVLICIDYLSCMYDITTEELQNIIDFKQTRTLERLQNGTLTIRR